MGTIILVFSVISLLVMGGLLIGAILGIIGGALALSFKPAAKDKEGERRGWLGIQSAEWRWTRKLPDTSPHMRAKPTISAHPLARKNSTEIQKNIFEKKGKNIMQVIMAVSAASDAGLLLEEQPGTSM